MNLVVAPEAPSWLSSLSSHRDLDLITSSLEVVTIPKALRRATTLWAQGRADRRLVARFWLRHAVDRRAARRVSPTTRAVFASSCSAQRTFAAARRVNAAIRCVLVEDLPDLRRLHADLDRAAAAHPEARFLRRYRARRSEVIRQQAERVLANTIIVRSTYAYRCRIEDGVTPERLLRLDASPPFGPRRPPNTRAPVILLAGLASARAGLFETLELLDHIPGARLVLRVGEGLEPVGALDRPNVRAGTTTEIRDLDGIDIVVAPSWCEAELPQLAVAALRGLPIVATTRAAGLFDQTAISVVEPGDAAGLVSAVLSAIGH